MAHPRSANARERPHNIILLAALGVAIASSIYLLATIDSTPVEHRRFFGLWRTRNLLAAIALLTLAAGLLAAGVVPR